jgi:hypothetical protein
MNVEHGCLSGSLSFGIKFGPSIYYNGAVQIDLSFRDAIDERKACMPIANARQAIPDIMPMF